MERKGKYIVFRSSHGNEVRFSLRAIDSGALKERKPEAVFPEVVEVLSRKWKNGLKKPQEVDIFDVGLELNVALPTISRIFRSLNKGSIVSKALKTSFILQKDPSEANYGENAQAAEEEA